MQIPKSAENRGEKGGSKDDPIDSKLSSKIEPNRIEISENFLLKVFEK
jgi:hypothetical protein